MHKLRVAAVQLNSQEDVEANLKSAESLIEAAVADGSRLVVLPEYANYLAETDKLKHAETLEGRTISLFRKIAEKHGVYLHCGSFIEKSEDPNRAFNTSVLIAPQGEVVAVYRKIHLFDVVIPEQVEARESATIKPGRKVVVADTDFGRVGLTICYDLRFPELYRALTDKGARLIFVPAAFTLYTGKDHWEPLLRARAIENQVFIIAAGQFGSHPPGHMCYGNSMVIDPWGTVIARAAEGVGYIIADIDWSIQERVRRNLPCLEHRALLETGRGGSV